MTRNRYFWLFLISAGIGTFPLFVRGQNEQLDGGTTDSSRKLVVENQRTGKSDRETRIYRVSAYCQNSCCCPGTADGITANGHRITKADYGRICAAPSSLPFGTVLHIKGLGRNVVVEDRGGAIKDAGAKVGGTVLQYPRLDILCKTHREAQEFGIKYLECKIIERD